MSTPDFTGKTDAELARFCSVASKTLTDITHRLAASNAETASLEAVYEQTAMHLNAATAELERRFS
jgi:hypothetical protein